MFSFKDLISKLIRTSRIGVVIDIRLFHKDREAWHAAVHGVTKSWTWLSNSNDIPFIIAKQWGMWELLLQMKKPWLRYEAPSYRDQRQRSLLFVILYSRVLFSWYLILCNTVRYYLEHKIIFTKLRLM